MQWQNEKSIIEQIRELKQRMENLSIEETRHEREGDFAKAAEIKHGRIPEAEQELNEKSEKLREIQENGQTLLREEVSDEDIAAVVSAWTGIPVSKMLESEKKKLLQLEDILGERVVGQERAINAVSEAIRRNKSGLSDPNRPTGVFMFLGPTGVGKTELAKTLAGFLFNDEHALTRIDMSEYMEKFSVSRLIGAPPGYVGYEQGGQLTEVVRRRPYSVILFDEIERAHQDVFNILLQLLDEGRLTDGQGRLVDFRNSIIIMTSNVGSDIILGTEDTEAIREQVWGLLQATFKPEFLNRLDEIITFNRLGKGEIMKIVDLEVTRVQARLQEHKIRLSLGEDAREFLASAGFDPAYGARPLKRAVQRLLENPLAKQMLAGEIKDGDVVTAHRDGDELAFETGRSVPEGGGDPAGAGAASETDGENSASTRWKPSA
jgi:ATP-dependent Clp protease ATP-binding subunit ClpB